MGTRLQFSFPGGIPSHVAPETPGSIHEGGELGYALVHAYGAAFDNPDLVVACVIGDGEAETGPLAASWHSNKFLDPPATAWCFHGLSHAWAAGRAAEMAPGSHRVVTCHLGAGASLAAVLDGRSVDTTMGFTPLDGLVMATRSGSVDPGLITWLEEYEGLAPHEVADALEHRSGLLGLAGTADMRELLNRTPTSALVVQAPTVVFVSWSSPPGRIYRSPPVSSAPWPRVAGRDDFTTIGITTRAVVPCRSRIPDAQAQRMPAETAPASIDAHRDVLWNAAAGLDPGRGKVGDRGGDRCGPAPQHPAARPPHHRHGRCRRSGHPHGNRADPGPAPGGRALVLDGAGRVDVARRSGRWPIRHPRVTRPELLSSPASVLTRAVDQ